MVLTVRLENDYDAENPIGQSGDSRERFVSFNQRHRSFADPDEFFEWTPKGYVPKIGLRRQLATGCAALLDYYEHGQCRWSLSGFGPQCRWDTSRGAGIYWLPTDVPKDMREEYARAALEEYTDWCNGNCYYYSIETDTGEHVDSCGGFIGSDYFMQEVADTITNYLKDHEVGAIHVEGGAAWLAQYHELPKENAA
jgi:hypothetical protein